MKLLYTANARIPSEKAHPYQIVQMCEAFAAAGAEVALLYAHRRNRPDLAATDLWEHYGVLRNFVAERIPCLDLYAPSRFLPRRLARLWETFAEIGVRLTYLVFLLPHLAREREAIVYSRDAFTLALIAALWPCRARRTFFEAHTFPSSGVGIALQRWLVRRIGGVVAITGHLAQLYHKLGLPPEQVIVAHDGIRRARFEVEGDRAAWRERLGWPQDAFIVGYVGRFQTLGMEKGLGDLVEATIRLAREANASPVHLALVGGPDDTVARLRARIEREGLAPDLVLYPGQVPPPDIPGYLRAFDVCTMPFPWAKHFAYHASPMKLFEYMASGRPIVASDLPSTAEVIRDGENGLLFSPSDVDALAAVLRRLRDDPALGKRLAARAAQDVLQYTWDARAQRILAFMQSMMDSR